MKLVGISSVKWSALNFYNYFTLLTKKNTPYRFVQMNKNVEKIETIFKGSGVKPPILNHT